MTDKVVVLGDEGNAELRPLFEWLTSELGEGYNVVLCECTALPIPMTPEAAFDLYRDPGLEPLIIGQLRKVYGATIVVLVAPYDREAAYLAGWSYSRGALCVLYAREPFIMAAIPLLSFTRDPAFVAPHIRDIVRLRDARANVATAEAEVKAAMAEEEGDEGEGVEPPDGPGDAEPEPEEVLPQNIDTEVTPAEGVENDHG